MADSRLLALEPKQAAPGTELKDPIEDKNYLPSQLRAACLEAPLYDIQLLWPIEQVEKRKRTIAQIISILSNPDFSMACPTKATQHLLPLWLDTIINPILAGVEAKTLDEFNSQMETDTLLKTLLCYEKMGGKGVPEKLKTARTLADIQQAYAEKLPELKEYQARVAKLKSGLPASSTPDRFDQDKYYVWWSTKEAFQTVFLQAFELSLDLGLECSRQRIFLLNTLMQYSGHGDIEGPRTPLAKQFKHENVEQYHFIVKKLFELCIQSTSPASEEALREFLKLVNVPRKEHRTLADPLEYPTPLNELAFMESFEKMFFSCSPEKLNLVLHALSVENSKQLQEKLMNKAMYYCRDQLKLATSDEDLNSTMVLRTVPVFTGLRIYACLNLSDDNTELLDRLSSEVKDPTQIRQAVIAGILCLAGGLNASYFLKQVEDETQREKESKQAPQKKKQRNQFFVTKIREENQACAQKTVDYVHSALSFFPNPVNMLILRYARLHQPQLPEPSKNKP